MAQPSFELKGGRPMSEQIDNEIRESLRYFGNLSLRQSLALEEKASEIGRLNSKLDEAARTIISLTARNAGMLDAHRNLLQGVN